MTFMQTILSLFGGFRQSTDTDLGPDAIAQARWELQADNEVDEAVLGRPRLVDRSGQFAQQYDAVIPVHCKGDATDPANLSFDVEGEEIEAFCEAMGVAVDTIGDVEGRTVPLEWDDGTPIPRWEHMDDDAPVDLDLE